MKRYKKLLIVLVTVLAAAGVFGAFQVYSRYRTDRDRRQAVEKLQNSLAETAARYQERSATLTIDGDNHVYTMTELGEHIYYEYENKTYELGNESSLASLLFDADSSISEEELDSLVQSESDADAVTKIMKELSSTYDTSAKNARINSHGKITASKPGHVLDTTSIYNDLTSYLSQKTTDNYSASYKTSAVEPAWTTEDLKEVNTVISSYSTSFVSTNPRGANIKIAASRLDNSFLLPGESISFLDVLYDDSDGKSYQKSGAFFKGKVVQAEGGGICQVSTTAYASFLFAGIIPTKRYPHSIPVSYSPLGLDAALSVGGKDLLVENTLDYPLLISAKTKGNTLNVHLTSYANALKGYRYKPRAEKLSSKKAKSYLDVYKNGKKVKTIFLGKDTYD